MKMKHRLATLALLACGCATLPAHAQDMKPGLWEVSNKVSSPDARMQSMMAMAQQHMANMSPEQRRQTEQMMQQNGIQLDIAPGGVLRTRMCMTREMIARKEFPVQQGDCKQSYTQQSGNKGRVAFSCTRPPISGEGEMTMLSDTSYQARMKMTQGGDGARQTMDMDVTGKWLGADCGALQAPGVKKK